MSGIVEHALRALRVLEEITRPPRRPFADTDEPLDYTQSLCPASATPGSSIRPRKVCNMCDTEITGTDYNYCVDHRVSSEPDQEVCEHPYGQCRVHHPAWTDWMCTKPFGHDDQHGYAGCFWTESPLSDDELVAVRGLIQERYEPESVAAYMARAERVDGGYIIHDTPEQAARMNDLAAATYSSATPPADGPAGVEHPPVPPAGIPLTGFELWDAAQQVDLCAAKASNTYAQERLESLATRLRDASRALRK